MTELRMKNREAKWAFLVGLILTSGTLALRWVVEFFGGSVGSFELAYWIANIAGMFMLVFSGGIWIGWTNYASYLEDQERADHA